MFSTTTTTTASKRVLQEEEEVLFLFVFIIMIMVMMIRILALVPLLLLLRGWYAGEVGKTRIWGKVEVRELLAVSFGGYPRWMARSLVIAAAPSPGVTQEIQLICTEAEFGFSISCDHFLLFE